MVTNINRPNKVPNQACLSLPHTQYEYTPYNVIYGKRSQVNAKG